MRRDMETKIGDVWLESEDIKTYVEICRFMYLNPNDEELRQIKALIVDYRAL